jgi:hypothetical protein
MSDDNPGPIFVTHDELRAILDAEWVKLYRLLQHIISDAMTACAKTWLPDQPAHIEGAAAMLESLALGKRDVVIAHLERGIAEKLHARATQH